MPVDPQFSEIIDFYRSIPPIHEMPLELLRDAQARPTPDQTPVDSVTERAIAGPASDITLRIYRNGDESGTLPLLLFMHGGGFVLGSLESHDEMARVLTLHTGCVTVSVDYRLAPEAPYPAAVEDCYSALCWAAEHAAELGADPARIIVIGDSAGGNLAAAMALSARDAGAPALAGQVLIYPVADLTAPFPPAPDGEYYLVYPELHDFFMESYISDEGQSRLPTASPGLAENLADLPPALVVTAEYDPLCGQGEALAQRLQAAGVRVAHTRYAGGVHGFATFPVPMRDALIQQVAEWIHAL